MKTWPLTQVRTENGQNRMFGYNKVRYRGLEKNTNRLYLLAGFANLLRAERHMVA
jgi:IS5 family transposase